MQLSCAQATEEEEQAELAHMPLTMLQRRRMELCKIKLPALTARPLSPLLAAPQLAAEPPEAEPLPAGMPSQRHAPYSFAHSPSCNGHQHPSQPTSPHGQGHVQIPSESGPAPKQPAREAASLAAAAADGMSAQQPGAEHPNGGSAAAGAAVVAAEQSQGPVPFAAPPSGRAGFRYSLLQAVGPNLVLTPY